MASKKILPAHSGWWIRREEASSGSLVKSASVMRSKSNGLSRQYQEALQNHVKATRPASARPAKALGLQARSIGLVTLDLVRIHEQALIKLVLPSYSPGTRKVMVRRAGTFFAQAITPIEETHRIARETHLQMIRLNDALRRRGAGRSEEH